MDYCYVGLIFGCPKKQELESCPFKPIRELILMERIKFYENLSSEIRLSIIEFHKKCSSNYCNNMNTLATKKEFQLIKIQVNEFKKNS